MRNLFFVFCCFFAVQFTLHAQNDVYRNTLSATSGFNGWQVIKAGGNLLNVSDSAFITPARIRVTGTWGATYDRAITKWFSIGLAGSYNKFSLSTDDFKGNVDTFYYSGQINASFRRINLGIRPNFHYLNNDRVDFYSGFRFGLNFYNTQAGLETDSNVPGDIFLEKLLKFTKYVGNGSRPTFQFIPVGFRGYITERLGVGFELAVGPTYFAAAQLNYRF